MGINFNYDKEQYSGFNVPQESYGHTDDWDDGTGFRNPQENCPYGFDASPDFNCYPGGVRRKKAPIIFGILAVIIFIFLLVFVLSQIPDTLTGSISPDDRNTIPYSSMTYERPDVDLLFGMIDDMTDTGWQDSYSDITYNLDAIYEGYWSFYTMYTLADIKFSIDTADEFYMDECLFLSENAPVLEQKMDSMLSSLANSQVAYRLNRDYFGSEYLVSQPNDITYDEEYIALLQRESALIYEYEAMISDPVIEIDGEPVYYTDYIGGDITSYEYTSAVQAYYDKYAWEAGEIYIELVKTRQDIAERLGFSSYSDYAYASYGRDYTADEARQYIDTVSRELVPAYSQLLNDGGFNTYYQFDGLSHEENAAALKSACRNMGGRIWDIYQYMEEYGLYDIAPSATKYPGSFQVYLDDWNAPFIFVNPSGTVADFTSFSHEFGHFVDAYVNYNSYITVDASEACSQSMAMLAPLYADTLSQEDLKSLRISSILDALSTYVEQGAYNAFEDRVYSLPENELTVENLMELSLECFTEYSMAYPGFEWYYSVCWIDIPHFFIQPYYVASYIISMDAALQVYELELDSPGTGVDVFMLLADRNWDLTYMENLTDIGLKTPFDTGRGDDAAKFILENLPGY